MRILTIGCGYIGSIMARDLAETLSAVDVTVSDSEGERAREIVSAIGRDNVHPIQLDVSDRQNLINTLEVSR